MADIESAVAQGTFGGAPYGDRQEVTGPPVVVPIPDAYREFLATDARSVLVTIQPHHQNFILNPAWRVDATGWEITPGSNTLDEESSWVGQSQVITETSTLRYVDTDKDGGSACIYIGPENDADAGVSDRSDTSRAYGEWTFSVYAKGNGRVRLRMDAYAPTEWGIAKSPPALLNPTQVSGDPNLWLYQSVPVQDENGTIWTPKEKPFYTTIGQAVTGDPATLGLADVTPAAVQAPDGTVWTVNADPTAVPVFDLWGTPEEVADPATAWPDDNGGTHLEFIRGTDGALWQQVSPDPGTPLDEDLQPIPPSEPAPSYWFYRPAPVPVVGDPSTVQPYYHALPQYLENGGNLYERKALPDQTPTPSHYDLLGALVSVADPANESPNTGQYLIHSTDSTVWILSEPTPYFVQYDGDAQPSVLGQWQEILAEDDWVRIVIRTAAKVQSADVERISFLDAYWIDGIIEVEPDSGEEIRISAAMLDPTEYPEAPYFDGSMGEAVGLDDFLWEGAENSSISWYFRERLKRTRWLWEVLQYSLPAGRPRQVYYHDAEHPYVPEDNSGGGAG